MFSLFDKVQDQYIILSFIFGLACFTFLRTFLAIIKVRNSITFLQLSPNLESPVITNDFYILVPLLREQGMIDSLYKMYRQLDNRIQIVFVTTEKEDCDYDVRLKEKLESNIQRLLDIKDKKNFVQVSQGIFFKEYAEYVFDSLQGQLTRQEKINQIWSLYFDQPRTKDFIMNLQDKRFIHIHYPFTEGTKAHQLNYACKYLFKEKIVTSEDYFVFYDADSTFSQDVFDLARHLIFCTQSSVIQQSAIYTKNFEHFNNTFKDKLVSNFGYIQTRWTLAHEIPRLRHQLHPFLSLFESGHSVGHGLMVKTSVFQRVDFFPEIFLNEDMVLGLIFRLNGYKIHVLPKLEVCNTPIFLNSLVNQYRSWFYGVFSYPKYILFCWENGYNKILSTVWGIRYFVRSLIWLLNSYFWFLLIVTSLAYSLYMFNIYTLVVFLFVIFTFFSYSIGSILLMNFQMKKLSNDLQSYFNWKNIFTMPISSLLYSVGPTLGLFDYIRSFILNMNIIKSKTER